MKTIKELKESGDYLDERNNGYYWALKNVLELIDELRLECPIQADKECWCTPLEQLKQKIEGKDAVLAQGVKDGK